MTPEKLHKLGFSLILLKPKRKQPVDSKWSTLPRSAIYDILDGLDDGCNLGFRPGSTSKTPDGRYLHGIDIDIRDPDYTNEAMAVAEEKFGRKFLKSLPRVISGSGGSSRHFYFTLSRPMRAKTIAHSTEKFFDESTGKMRWYWEIEVFGEGKQLVLPPSIHPDTGKPYRWIKPPEEFVPALEEGRLDEIIDELTRKSEDFEEGDMAPLGIELAEADSILSKLDLERWFIEREGWRNVGMALHHEFNGSKDAYRLWTKYSKKAPNFDLNEQRYQWSTFGRNDRVRPIRIATLIKDAKEAEIRQAFKPTDDDAEEIREVVRKEKEKAKSKASIKKTAGPRKSHRIDKSTYIYQPKELLTIPGILGEIVEAYNNSAPRPQKQFAVHTALALGSVILGRNWRTSGSNYSSLYFLMLGKTASGKEHGLKVVDQVLAQCDIDRVGPSRYTSDAGLMSALEIRPVHISLADEFSRYLKSARSSGDANQSNAQSALMEIWGRLDGVHRNKGYSARGMSKAQMEEMASSHVKRPALSLLGVATPEDFYNAIGDEDVANGFLNRFLICETEVPRLPMRTELNPIVVSAEFKKWARNAAYPMVDGDDDIMDAINRNNSTDPGEPLVVNFTDKSWEILSEIDGYCLAKMDELDAFGLDGLYGRAREIIMRLSLIVAMSCESENITSKHVEWSRDYFMYHAEKLENRTKDDMGASETQRIVTYVHAMIEEVRDDDKIIGLSMREIVKNSRMFRNLDSRGREEIVKLLNSDYGVVIRSVNRNGSKKSTKVLTLRDDL